MILKLFIKNICKVLLLWLGMMIFTFMMMQYGFGLTNLQSIHLNDLSEIIARWPATLELGILAMLLAIVIGIAVGIVAAVYYQKPIDRVLISTSLMGYSIPVFWWALILILIFSVTLEMTPVSGRLNVMFDVMPVTGFMLIDTLLPKVIDEYHFDAFTSAISHLILPTVVLASLPLAVIARMTRVSLLEVLSKDYIVAARAKGLSEYRIILIHAMRNAIHPILSAIGVLFISIVIMGSVVVEVIFAWPGVGNYIIQSVYAKNYAVVQLFLWIMGTVVIITNAGFDWVNNRLNPRKGT